MTATKRFTFVLPPLGVLVIHQLATVFDWYRQITEFDVGMHALGGAAIALSWILLGPTVRHKTEPRWYYLFVSLGIVALAATAWELYEFLLDQHQGILLHQPSIADTMGDYAAGLLGGLFVTGYAILSRK